jgi:hypothetical protein
MEFSLPTQVRQFDPQAKRVTNGEYAERGAITICDYSAVCNPDDFNIADLITGFGISATGKATTSGPSFVGPSGTGKRSAEERG